MRRARISLHRYIYLITLDRVGPAWTMSTQGTATCELAITRSYYRTVLVMTERFS
jgi:hypothetical protein